MKAHWRVLGVAIALASPWADADEVRVAVAANFAQTLTALAEAFTAATGHRVLASTASTGKHYAQIRNGAPFEVFLAADAERPARLEAEGLSVPGTRFTYAVGRLVLWSPRPGYVDADGAVLNQEAFRHLAIANPKTAPYGDAARQVLTHLGLWDSLQARLVRGENVGQAFQFIASGNAELGFVALAQIQYPGSPVDGSRWLPPADWYAPLLQQAVLLPRGRDHAAARALLAFLRGSPVARQIIEAHGYALP